MTDKEKFIAIVNNDCISSSDAIILLEGDGYNRYRHASNLYKQGLSKIIVFSGNITDFKYGSYPFQYIYPKLLREGVPSEAIIYEDKSLNTREQAVNIIQLCKQHNWKRIILVGSPDHQYRAYLTFLKEVINTYSPVIIYNSTAPNKGWYKDDGWGTKIERLEQEFISIEKYSQLGHLATYKEAIDYQQWKESMVSS